MISTNTGIDFPNDSLAQADKSTLISIIGKLASELSELKSRVSDVSEHTGRISKELAETNGRVSDLEENTNTGSSDASEPDKDEANTKGKGSDDESTALEQVCALSDDESREHLTANQSRAKKVACRIDEYGKSVPAGIAITSSRLRDVLSGLEDKRIHRQTVQRVMGFLERFGGGHISQKQTRGGKTVVVFSESVVSRVKAVVTGNENPTVTPTIL
jgi:hypothetical protein